MEFYISEPVIICHCSGLARCFSIQSSVGISVLRSADNSSPIFLLTLVPFCEIWDLPCVRHRRMGVRCKLVETILHKSTDCLDRHFVIKVYHHFV